MKQNAFLMFICVSIVFALSLSACGNQNDTSDISQPDTSIDSSPAQAITEFSKQFGIGDFNIANAVGWTSDGSILITFGSFNGNPIYDIDNMEASIMKIDGNGNMMWRETLGGPNQDNFRSLLSLNSGGCILAGRYDEDRPGEQYAQMAGWVVKLDPEGNTEWEQIISRENTFQINDALLPGNSRIALGGSIDNSQGDSDCVYMLLDENGELISEEFYPPALPINRIDEMHFTLDDNILLIGTMGEFGDFHNFARMIDPVGNTIWFNEYTDMNSIHAATDLNEGTIYFITQSEGQERIEIRCINGQGEFQDEEYIVESSALSSNLLFFNESVHFCATQKNLDGVYELHLIRISDNGPEDICIIDVPFSISNTDDCMIAWNPDGSWLCASGSFWTESGQNTLIWLATKQL